MTLDTNILIAYLNGEQAVVDFINEHKEVGRAIFICSISFAEVLSLPTLSEAYIDRARRFLENFISVPFDNELAEATALLRRRYQFSIPDAAIVATALIRQTPLVSRDKVLRRAKEVTFVDL
jgi:predicted nucleic acid-binding protein